mmetsp:Transcript_94701/g.263420  ORF Transcript_94701/g.263420 Transcript_94701/m.263420 type:complete len:255 (-) Transcript_94701:12-776(-)
MSSDSFMPGSRFRMKLRKKDGRGSSFSFFCLAFLAPPPFTFLETFSTVTFLPAFHSMSLTTIFLISMSSPLYGFGSSVWYSFQICVFVKYGFSEKVKTSLKPLLGSSSSKFCFSMSSKYSSTGSSHFWMYSYSSNAGWCCIAFNQKPLRAGVPTFGSSPSAVVSSFLRSSRKGFCFCVYFFMSSLTSFSYSFSSSRYLSSSVFSSLMIGGSSDSSFSPSFLSCFSSMGAMAAATKGSPKSAPGTVGEAASCTAP